MPPKDRLLKQKRIFVGFNSAGAAGIYAFTRVLRRRGYRIDFYGLNQTRYDMPVDFLLKFSPHWFFSFWQRVFYFFRLLPRYDIWHLNFTETFFFYPLNLLILKIFSKKIVLTCRGGDVRQKIDFLPKSILERPKTLWPVFYAELIQKSFIERFKIKMRTRIFTLFADKVILTGPFLASDVPNYDCIIPYARNLKVLKPISFGHHRIKILHIPSDEAAKGTEIIRDAFQKLTKKYPRVNFEILPKMTREKLLGETARADIVIDQIVVGWYGGQAVEAMAMGKIVVAFLNPTYLALVDFGQEIPIWKTTPWSLAADLEILLDVYPAIQKKWAKKSVEFARKIHRSGKIAQQYLEIYREIG